MIDIGSIVQLKVGGPIMTVTRIGCISFAQPCPDDHVWAEWYDDDGALHKDGFPPVALEEI